jgi:hypothetical protein
MFFDQFQLSVKSRVKLIKVISDFEILKNLEAIDFLTDLKPILFGNYILM